MKADFELKELLLRAPRLTLAVAESVTCGRIQATIGAVSGASEFFRGGITAYSIDQKVRHLGVDRARADAVDCVSADVAEEMARGACMLFGADLGLATTGYAEPAPALRVLRPFAWWGFARRTANGNYLVVSGRVEPPAGLSRTQVQEVVTEAALAALVQHLRELRAPDGAAMY